MLARAYRRVAHGRGEDGCGGDANIRARRRRGPTSNASTASIACRTRSTFGQLSTRSRISPPGRTKGSVWKRAPGSTRPHDVHARDDGAVVVRGPAHEREDAAGLEAGDAAAAIEDLSLRRGGRSAASVRSSSRSRSARHESERWFADATAARRAAAMARCRSWTSLRDRRGIRARGGRAACRRRWSRAGKRRP